MKSHPNRHQLLPAGWSLRAFIVFAAIFSFGISVNATLGAGCPGTINFDNSAGTGLWDTPANWDTNILPGPGDDVCIAGHGVTLSGVHSVASLTVDGAGSLTMTGGQLALAGASLINGSLFLNEGDLTGAGNLTVNGATVWGGGQMSGTGRTKVSGGMSLTGSGFLRSGRVLEVPSGATVSMSANLIADLGSATVENSGTWNVTNDSDFLAGSSGTKTLVNLATGILSKTGGTGVTECAWTTFNNTGGTVQVQSGELRPNFGTHTGPFLISAGTLNLRTTIVFNAGSSVTGGGAVTMASGTTSFNAGSSFAPGGTMRIDAGTLSFDTGAAVTLPNLTLTGGELAGADTVTVTGTTDWSDGVMMGSGRTKVSGGMNLTGFGYLRTGRVLEVPAGALVSMSGHLVADSGPATVENSGTWNVTNDSDFLGASSGTKTIVNLATGTLSKTGGTGVTESTWTTFNNTGGTVQVQSGELRPNFGTHTGPFLVSAGTLNLRATMTFNAGSSVTGGGAVTMSSGTTSFNAGSSFAPGGTMQLDAGTLSFNTGAAVTLPSFTMTGGELAGADTVTVTGTTHWTDGVMLGSGRTRVSGVTTLAGSNVFLRSGRILEVLPGATVSMSSSLVADSGPATVENGGTWNVTNDSDFFSGGTGIKTVVNLATGTFRKSAGGGLSAIGWHSFSNAGTVESLTGTLDVSSYTQTAGATLAGAGATLSSGSAMTVLAGLVGGAGTITAPSLASSGELSPGLSSPAILGLSGAYGQSTAGRYRAQVGGLAPGSGHDRVNVTGAATLGGELLLEVVDGFTPSLGDTYTLMTFPSRGGTMFSSFNPAPAPCGLDWNLVYADTSVFAQVVAGQCPDGDGDGLANCCHPACILVDGDTCGDCNDADAGAIALPLEATNLLFGSDKVTLSWTSVIPQAGSATVHDVVTGQVSELPVGNGGSETCLTSAPAATTMDSNVPDPGAAKWYLVRGRNSCGAGIYGRRSNGAINDSPACP